MERIPGLSEKAAKAFFEATEDPTFLLDLDGIIIHANPAASELLQMPLKELVGKGPDDLFPPEVAENLRMKLQQIVRTGKPAKVEDVRDGRVFDITCYPVEGEGGEVEAIATVVHEKTEYIKAKTAVRDSEEKFRRLIEGLDEAVYRMTLPEGRYEYISPSAKKVFGYGAEEFRSTPLFIKRIIHPEFRKQFQKLWDEMLEGNVPRTYEYKILDPAGNERWILQSNCPIHNDAGELVAIEGLCRNITGVKHSLAALRSSEDKLMALANQLPVGVLRTDLSGSIVYANRVFASMMGFEDADGVVHKSFRDFHEEPGVVEQLIAGCTIDSPSAGADTRLIDMRGATVWVRLTAQAVIEKDGEIGFHDWSVEDVTEHRLVEESRRESDDRFRNLSEKTSDWIWEIDTNGVITYSNQQAKQVLGYETLEILGHQPVDFMPKAEAADNSAIFVSILKSCEQFDRLECTYRHKNGKLVILETSGHPIYNAHGRFCGYRGICRDITRQVQTENELKASRQQLQQQARELESLGDGLKILSDTFATEFGNPLEKIEGFGEELSANLGDRLDDKGRLILKRITHAGRRMQQIVRATLKLANSKGGELKLSQVDLSRIARRVARGLQESHPDAGVEFHIAGEITATCDRELVAVAIESLLEDAFRYARENGAGSVVRFERVGDGAERVFRVTCNGSAARAHEPLSDERGGSAEGTNGEFGLASAKRIIQLHGGRLWLEREPGKAPTYYISLA